ncbi:hypothetical protein Q7P37_001553 [Cladosporium fusiforme]
MVTFTRAAVFASAIHLAFGSVLPLTQDKESSILRRQDSWEEYDQDNTEMAVQGICRVYLDDTSVDGLATCTDYCGSDSNTCGGAGGKGAPIKTNPDGARYNIGECWCSSPELEKLVEFTADGLQDLDSITCAVWLQALKESVNLSTWVIPSAAGAAAKAAKTVIKSIKKAEKLGGKEGWTNFIESTCGIEEWDFDISEAFDLGQEADDQE